MTKAKKVRNVKRTKEGEWTWDAVTIATALFLGFGPFTLLAIFGGPSNIKMGVDQPVAAYENRSVASEVSK